MFTTRKLITIVEDFEEEEEEEEKVKTPTRSMASQGSFHTNAGLNSGSDRYKSQKSCLVPSF